MPLSRLDEEHRHRHAPSHLREGTILNPPLTAEGWMRVGLDDVPGSLKVCPWMTRVDDAGAVVAPEAGFAAALMESDAGNWWVLAWWPQ